jgi:hypothetical protein
VVVEFRWRRGDDGSVPGRRLCSWRQPAGGKRAGGEGGAQGEGEARHRAGPRLAGGDGVLVAHGLGLTAVLLRSTAAEEGLAR